ncbi:ribbon-helix-helix protein, CopG family [Haloarculaceae archaeon H-GB2-1]|nr:ribbon-helix-helix protein, CopG family [Haloarculaceae archaeon H-GB1-1]MEA5387782.1 ribbon-helix-helix protein, CopG family [Haloarculaceae archaeon H-GB11]MEA5409280.1 ribbon-helix-helix protein, CopG family [Haloarculaceae archaeon H-GB2-1]
MTIDRVTVSLDEDAKEALEDLTERTGHGQSELFRRALTFYAANYKAAKTDAGTKLGDYHKMLSGGEHVLLDVDFLHCFLDYVTDSDGNPDPTFLESADQVSDYHAREYDGEFATLDELLEWLSLCGFLSVRRSDENRYHVVFPSDQIRWFMTRFIELSVVDLPFDIEIEEGLTKVLITEYENETGN